VGSLKEKTQERTSAAEFRKERHDMQRLQTSFIMYFKKRICA